MVTCQMSSIGAIDRGNWFGSEFTSSVASGKSQNPIPKIRIVFPSEETMLESSRLGDAMVILQEEYYNSKNKAEGWITVTALGNFNTKTSGHLILWELGLVVEFPAGLTILFPSTIICHRNVPIKPCETQASLTQFATGRLFHYADLEFKTDKKFKEVDLAAWKRLVKERKKVWATAVKNYSHYDSLQSDREIFLYGNTGEVA